MLADSNKRVRISVADMLHRTPNTNEQGDNKKFRLISKFGAETTRGGRPARPLYY